jgi:hypothetical protein
MAQRGKALRVFRTIAITSVEEERVSGVHSVAFSLFGGTVLFSGSWTPAIVYVRSVEISRAKA